MQRKRHERLDDGRDDVLVYIVLVLIGQQLDEEGRLVLLAAGGHHAQAD